MLFTEKENFSVLFRRVALRHRHKFENEELLEWWKFLKAYPFISVEKSFDIWTAKSKHFPRIAEILELIKYLGAERAKAPERAGLAQELKELDQQYSALLQTAPGKSREERLKIYDELRALMTRMGMLEIQKHAEVKVEKPISNRFNQVKKLEEVY
jgi:uncharacterized protein YciW